MRGLAVFLALLLAAPFARAQVPREERDRHYRDAIAQTLIDAMRPADHGDWAEHWSSVGSRMRHARWHLAPLERPHESGSLRRTGWLSEAGTQAGILACGGAEDVYVIAFNMPDSMTSDTGLGVLDALRERGAIVEPLSATRDSGEYTLTVPGRISARLTRELSCTSPMSAAAQRCETDFRLIFRNAVMSEPAAADALDTCIVGFRRY